eukprot:TRINITY_DN15724_c0_g1_i1.p2 TRINITY_DN15724_c0_g1~~TRINITY_DN15724_c0_g1_i1.p2  ORF type:complete len:284 (+),score=62.16 TRINITY_DN15724_c0_g1_i1:95-853(+)
MGPRRAGPVLLLAAGCAAWTASSSSNDGLVTALRADGRFSDPRVERALRATDRALYVQPGSDPYQDSPQSIGYGATISAPHMHAACLEELRHHAVPGATVLDVGSGSGYLVAALAEMVGPEGRVHGVEHSPQLAAQSRRRLRTAVRRELADSWRVHVGDGRRGLPQYGPYDAIHVGASAAESDAEAIARQLRPGGRMVSPVRTAEGEVLAVYDKDATGAVRRRTLFGVRYVPLTDYSKQYPGGEGRYVHDDM